MDRVGEVRHVAVIEFPGQPIIDFYSHLGFSRCIAEETPSPEYLGQLSGGAFRKAAVTKYANAGGSILEVISLKEPALKAVTSWSHVAITVLNCHRTVAELCKLGGSLVGGPTQSPDGPYMVAYLRDPSGNLVELVEPTQPS